MSAWKDWLDHRTGYRRLLSAALYESIPGGARWRYVWGSTLTFALAVQLITGVILWTAYSANASGAWESVYYIQTTMSGGWILRGIHHYMAQLTTVLLVLHLMQVVIDGAYRAPREVNFWFGLILLFLVLGLSLTGYLLPWDQKGYWATKVATSIAGITPVVGERCHGCSWVGRNMDTRRSHVSSRSTRGSCRVSSCCPSSRTSTSSAVTASPSRNP